MFDLLSEETCIALYLANFSLNCCLSLSEFIVCCHLVCGSKYCYVYLDFNFHGVQPSSPFCTLAHSWSSYFQLISFLQILKWLIPITFSTNSHEYSELWQVNHNWCRLSPFLGQCKRQVRIVVPRGAAIYAGIILRITGSFKHKHNFGNNGLKTGIIGLKPEVQLAMCLASYPLWLYYF